jgi:peroxiredoxin/protocatechuate 3,4-dioxygenase beta subunit
MNRRNVALLAAGVCLAGAGLGAKAFGQATQPAAGAGAAQTQPSGLGGAELEQVASREMVVEVVDSKTREPVAGVELKLTAQMGKTTFKSTTKSDEKGIARVLVPVQAAKYLNMASKKEEYAPMAARWPVDWSQEGTARTLAPDKFTFVMQKGTLIGGKVVDDAGQSVEGATVTLSMYCVPAEAPNQLSTVVRETVNTGADGTWTFKSAPETLGQLTAGVLHAKYDSGEGGGSLKTAVYPEAAARDGSLVLTLKRGVPIEGVVYGADGKPLAKAMVGIAKSWIALNGLPEVQTDKEGKFVLVGSVGQQSVTLMVRAGGHAPELKTIQMGTPAEIRLESAKVLKGRVVDAKGEPIAGVTVSVSKWRGTRGNFGSMTTDAQGRFEWKAAPADGVEFAIFKKGYAASRDRVLVAGEEEVTVRMAEPTVVSGTVVDSETGAAVPSFWFVEGKLDEPGGKPYWLRQQGKGCEGKDGKFEFTVRESYPEYVLRVEAEGYLPADSREYKTDEGKVELAYKLVKSKGIAGVVRDPAGQVVAGADLTLVTRSNHGRLVNGTIEKQIRDESMFTTSGPDGTYRFAPQLDPYVIVVVHERGYAEVKPEAIAKTGDITLEAWAKIQGRVMIGDKLAAQAEVMGNVVTTYSRNTPNVWHTITAKTDDEGRFECVRVPPRNIAVGRQMKTGTNMTLTTHQTIVALEPGKTAQVMIGGTGRPVTGSVEIAPEMKAKGWSNFGMSSLIEKVVLPEWPVPQGYKEMSLQEKQTWRTRFMESPEGKAFVALVAKRQNEQRRYPIKVEADGSFRIEDVPAGSYDLWLVLYEKEEAYGDPAAKATTEVVVAEMAEGRSKEPQAVPVLRMTAVKTFKAGDAAPGFEVKTLEGKDLKLADFKGKLTLVVFWATWCGPCVAELPELKAVYERFKGNGKFAMVSLSLDEEAQTAREFVQKEEIKWEQGFLGSWAKSKVTEEWGVNGIPSVWLIGPDGTVVSKSVVKGTMKEVVDAALGKVY